MDDRIIYTPWQVLSHWWIGAVAFGVSLVATPIARHIAYRTKVVDRPDDLLKPHGRPVAYLGGVAMYVGLLVGLIAYAATMPMFGLRWGEIGRALADWRPGELLRNPLWSLMSIAMALGVITAMGLIDDIRSLKPRQKIIWQTVAAGILLLGGVGHKMSGIFLAPMGAFADCPLWLVVPASAAMCVVLVIATCNATNLLDGLDGLCGGVTEIITLGFLALAVWLAMWQHSQIVAEYDAMRVGLCLAMAGAILGFLPYNVPPASIFMGDAGSMLLGFFVATMMAMFCQENTPRWVLAAVVVYALPIADTSLAVVRRLLAHKSIFTGDRSHLYDQLVDRGMTVKRVVAMFYVLAALAAVVGVTLAVCLRFRYALMIYIALAVAVWIVFWRMKMVKPPPKNGGP